MTQPQDEQDEQSHEPGEGFDPQRLRTLTDMRRTREDKMIAGVCSGTARHLNIDPVIPRVVLATLTLFGLSGLIVYGAVWLLIPEDGKPESIASKTFNLGENEEQFRVVGLIIAAIIAIVSASSLIGGDAFDTPFPYLGLVALFFLWLFVIRPYQQTHKRQEEALGAARTEAPDPSPMYGPAYGPVAPPGAYGPAPGAHGPEPGAHGPEPSRSPPPPNPRHDHGILTALTVFVTMIALGGLWVFSAVSDTVRVPVFLSLALALAVIGLGMLVGTFVGNGRPLIPLGILTAIALVFSVTLPTPSVGARNPEPTAAAHVQGEYSLGIGDMRLDLSDVADLDALNGRTIVVEEGIGSLHVIVPHDLDVDIDAETGAGQIRLFGRERSGSQISMSYVDPVDDGPGINLVLGQNFGNIEVTRPGGTQQGVRQQGVRQQGVRQQGVRQQGVRQR